MTQRKVAAQGVLQYIKHLIEFFFLRFIFALVLKGVSLHRSASGAIAFEFVFSRLLLFLFVVYVSSALPALSHTHTHTRAPPLGGPLQRGIGVGGCYLWRCFSPK